MRDERNIPPKVAQRMLLRFLRNDLVEEVLGDRALMVNRNGTKTQSSAKCLDTLAALSALASSRLSLQFLRRSTNTADSNY